MDTQPAKEEVANASSVPGKQSDDKEQDPQERNPHRVLQKRREQISMSQPIFQKRIPNISTAREHDDTSQPNLETVQIIPIDLESPSEKEIVQKRERGTGGDPVVREHVRHHRDLVMHGGVRPKEHPKLLVDRSQAPPGDDRVEDEFVTT